MSCIGLLLITTPFAPMVKTALVTLIAGNIGVNQELPGSLQTGALILSLICKNLWQKCFRQSGEISPANSLPSQLTKRVYKVRSLMLLNIQYILGTEQIEGVKYILGTEQAHSTEQIQGVEYILGKEQGQSVKQIHILKNISSTEQIQSTE